MYRTVLDEVSLLSPGVKPAEPLPRVARARKAPAERSEPAAGEINHEPAQLIRREGIGQILGIR